MAPTMQTIMISIAIIVVHPYIKIGFLRAIPAPMCSREFEPGCWNGAPWRCCVNPGSVRVSIGMATPTMAPALSGVVNIA